MTISVIILLGPPGSGKGTQAKELVKKNSSWMHISTGDLFRAEISSGSELGKSVKSILDSGQLVSDQVTDKVFQSQVKKLIQEKKPRGLLLDGYPRTEAQAKSLLEFSKNGGDNLANPIVVEFKIDKEEVVRRLSGRLINPRTGKIYGMNNPPKKPGICDDDGGELIQRADDRPETVRDRVKLYEGQRDAILRGLGSSGKAFSLDAVQSTAQVSDALIKVIEAAAGSKVFNA